MTRPTQHQTRSGAKKKRHSDGETRSGGLQDFWSVYDASHDEMQVVLTQPLENHAKFGSLMAKQSKAQRDAESDQSRRRLAKAIETNDWADYDTHLRQQGALYANLGIGFRDWYDVIRLVAGYMVPKLTAAFLAEPDRLVAALQAQGEFYDRAMAVIGEAYIERSEARLSTSVATAQGVTAQEQASQYARSLIEASLDPLVTISPEGKITDVNEGSIKVTGVAREKLVGTDFSDYFTEPEKAREGYQQVFAKGFVTDYPLTIRHKDGRLTDVLYNASVYKDAGGNVLGVFAAARDVTEQKQASQYARSLIEASLDPLVTISPEGKITDVNEGSIKVTGVAREKLVGTDFSDYFTEPEKAREGYQQVFAKGFVTDYPLTIRHRNHRLTEVLYNASVYKDTHGGVLGVFAAARDVTAQKRAEAEIAEQRSKELERLSELERFQKLTVGRELRMMELKKEIEELKRSQGKE